MELSSSDIQIIIRFLEGPFDARVLLNTFDNLENALYSSDRRDIEDAAREVGFSHVVRDAALERLRRYRHHRLQITEARSGSVEIIGLVLGVAAFVLSSTVGEAFKEGFKDTHLYEELKYYFQNVIDEKTLFIAEHIRRSFSSKKLPVNVKVLPASSASETQQIVVEIDLTETSEESVRVLPLGEQLGQLDTRR